MAAVLPAKSSALGHGTDRTGGTWPLSLPADLQRVLFLARFRVALTTHGRVRLARQKRRAQLRQPCGKPVDDQVILAAVIEAPAWHVMAPFFATP